MDAKRIITVLPLNEDQGLPAELARRLELSGADEFLFDPGGHPPSGSGAWLREVAASVFIPFSVKCGFARLEEVLAAGADQAILQVAPAQLAQLDRASLQLGRNRLVVEVSAAWTPERGWRAMLPQEDRDALEWMTELGQMGAGAILLSTGAEADLGGLCQSAAHLSLPVLYLSDAPTLGLEALLHGADGWAYAEAGITPAEHKATLAGHGVLVRQ